MCGIVAVINKYTNGYTTKQLEVFETLLYIDGLRGLDSTGVIAVDNVGNFTTLKGAVPVTTFSETSDWGKLRQESFRTGAALIGHNRKATKGTVIDANAHPFVINEQLAFVHNGTMYGDHKKHLNVEVDSHAIAHVLYNQGMQYIEDHLSVAYCFFWYDQRNSSVNLVRNTQRPMFWAETVDAFYYASEACFLSLAAERNGIRFYKDAIHEQPEHTQTVFTLKDKVWDISEETIVPKLASPASYWGTFNSQVNSSPVEKPIQVCTPPYSETEKYEKKLMMDYQLEIPNVEIDTWALKQFEDVSFVNGIFLGYQLVSSEHPESGWYLYFTSLLTESTEPYLYRLYRSITHNTEAELETLKTNCPVYELTLGTTKKRVDCGYGTSGLVVGCTFGVEVSSETTA